MVEVLASPTAGYLFLVRSDKSAVDHLAKLRGEVDQLKQAHTQLQRDGSSRLAVAGRSVELASQETQRLEREADERLGQLTSSRKTEAALRERLVAFEYTLDLFRKEVGRARAVEIETDSAELARDAFGEVERRTSAAVVEIVANDLSAYMQDHGLGRTYTGARVSIPDHVRELAGRIAARLGW